MVLPPSCTFDLHSLFLIGRPSWEDALEDAGENNREDAGEEHPIIRKECRPNVGDTQKDFLSLMMAIAHLRLKLRCANKDHYQQ